MTKFILNNWELHYVGDEIHIRYENLSKIVKGNSEYFAKLCFLVNKDKEKAKKLFLKKE